MDVKITIDSRVIILDKIELKSGNIDKIVYSHDWYGNKPGLIITPLSANCSAKLTVKHTNYY